MDANDTARTGGAPFTSSAGRWREPSRVPTFPGPPARRADRFPKPRCNQPKCRPPVRPPPVCLPEECPLPASAGTIRHITARKIRIMRVGRTRKAIRLAMAFPSPGNLFPVYSCSRAQERGLLRKCLVVAFVSMTESIASCPLPLITAIEIVLTAADPCASAGRRSAGRNAKDP